MGVAGQAAERYIAVLRCIFDCILCEVAQDLFEQVLRSFYFGGILRQMNGECLSFFGCLFAQWINGSLQGGIAVCSGQRELLLAAFLIEAGQLQQVVDQAAHALGFAVDDCGEMSAVIRLGEVVVHQGLGKAGNGGQRGGQFMGGISDELGLAAADFLQQGDVVEYGQHGGLIYCREWRQEYLEGVGLVRLFGVEGDGL